MNKSIHIKLILVLIGYLGATAFGVTFIPQKTTELKLGNNEILLVGSIAVNDENIFITDRKAANIKILDHQGSLVKVFGRKGYGPNEFQQPITSYISGNTYYVLDLSLDRLQYFKVSKDFISKIKHWYFGNYFSDMKPSVGNRFFVAGYFSMDGSYVSLAEFDPYTEKLTKKILYAKQWMGVKTEQEVEKKWSSTYRYLPYSGYFEVTNTYLFFVPGSHLTILRLDKKSKIVKRITGKSTRFIEPELPIKDFERASQTRNYSLWLDSIQRRSIVLDTFLFDDKYLMVVFSYFNKEKNTVDLYYHAYDLVGKFLKEDLLLRSRSLYTDQMAFFYDTKNKSYYVLNSYDKDDDSIVSRIHRFKVIK